jgi:hypothetical protein
VQAEDEAKSRHIEVLPGDYQNPLDYGRCGAEISVLRGHDYDRL